MHFQGSSDSCASSDSHFQDDGGDHSFPTFNSKAPVSSTITGPGYRITVLTSALIRFEYHKTDIDDGVGQSGESPSPDARSADFEDRPSTFAVNRDMPTPRFSVIDTEAKLEVLTDQVYLQYWKGGPFGPENTVVAFRTDVGFSPGEWRYGLPNEHFGNLKGTARTLDGVDGDNVEVESGVLATGGFAFLDDSKSFLFAKDGWIGTRRPGSTDGYLFAHGRDYRRAIREFFAISGKPPLPPRYALGVWYTRFYPYTAEQYLALMDRFRDEGVPLTVSVIDISWHIMDNIPSDQGSAWTGFTWEKDYFPDPKAFMEALHGRGLKVTLNNHPSSGIRYFEDMYERVCEFLGKDASTKMPVAFDPTDRKFMEAYFNIVCRARENEGCDFWWIDWQQGPYSAIPGVDPLWMLNHYHYRDNGRNGQRALTLSRYGGPGSHRYPLGFSGDTACTWGSLEYQPEFTATASNIGYGWWSHDIGGHLGGYKDGELTARWAQLGIFSPILRIHCSDNQFTTREPWKYNPEARASMSASYRLRKRFLPYLSSMAVLCSSEGRTLIEPMYYDHPFEEAAYAHKRAFWFGTECVVAPIGSPRSPSAQMGKSQAWLPPGTYVDIFEGIVYNGNTTVTLYRTLEHCPALAKEGAIIPLQVDGEVEHGCPLPSRIEVILVIGADGEFAIVEDDDTGNDPTKMTFARTPITFTQATGVITIGPATNPIVKEREWSFRLPAYSPPKDFTPVATVTSPSNSLDKTTELQLETKTDDRGFTTFSLPFALASEKEIKIHLSPSPALAKNDWQKLMYDRLDLAHMSYNDKRTVWWAVTNDHRRATVAPRPPAENNLSRATVMSRLLGMEFDDEVRQGLLEVLTADM